MLSFCYYVSFQTVRLVNTICKCLLTAQSAYRTNSGASVVSTSRVYLASLVDRWKLHPRQFVHRHDYLTDVQKNAVLLSVMWMIVV